MNMRPLRFVLLVVLLGNGAAYANADAATNRPRGQPQNAWRYQFYNGRWWFWAPDSRWAYYDGRQWITSPVASSRSEETSPDNKAEDVLPVVRGIDPTDANRNRRFYSPFVSGWQSPGTSSPAPLGISPMPVGPTSVPEASFGGTRARSGDAGSGVGGGAVGGTTVTGGPGTGLAK
ncbi:MAG TPA: hypothetical protein VHC22_11990 [Pirellulales bacterium]|nr:hypothetical protein [Pirellulales bacterium]